MGFYNMLKTTSPLKTLVLSVTHNFYILSKHTPIFKFSIKGKFLDNES